MSRFGWVIRDGGGPVLLCFLVGTCAAFVGQVRLSTDLATALILLGAGMTVHAHGMARLHVMGDLGRDTVKAAYARWLDAALVASAVTIAVALCLRAWTSGQLPQIAGCSAAVSGCVCVYLGFRSLGSVRR